MLVFINPFRLLYMCLVSISPELMTRPVLWTNPPVSDVASPQVVTIDAPLIQSVYTREKESGTDVIPPFHVYSRYHYEHIYRQRYGNLLSYADYCRLEQALSMMLLTISSSSDGGGEKAVVFNDPWWMDDESVVSYWTKGERNSIDRLLRIDLDKAISEKIEAFPIIYHESGEGRKIPDIIWNQHLQPRI
jgi:hypothetical protein